LSSSGSATSSRSLAGEDLDRRRDRREAEAAELDDLEVARRVLDAERLRDRVRVVER